MGNSGNERVSKTNNINNVTHSSIVTSSDIEWKKTKKIPYEHVQDELISVIILSRNEELLSRSINNMSIMAENQVEFIVVLDGDYKGEYQIDINPTLHNSHDIKFITHKTALGRRPSTNEAAKHARGKYLFHIDAHVKTDVKGWDRLLKQSCVTKTTMVITSFNRLILPEYECEGSGMSHRYISKDFADRWSGIKPVHDLVPTIVGSGAGWLLEKEYFDSFGGCDLDSPAYWGNFGLEWALKVWLCDFGLGVGQVLLSKEIIFAHHWKQEPTYSAPRTVQDDRMRLKRLYLNGNARNQVRPFSFFEKHLFHLIPKNIPIKSKDGREEPLRVLT